MFEEDTKQRHLCQKVFQVFIYIEVTTIFLLEKDKSEAEIVF